MPGAVVLLVRCPCPDADSAARIADAGLDARLAAAATTTAGESRYRWNGSLHRHPETVLTLTTLDARRTALCDLIDRLHPYELPAITWVPAGASATTVAWATACCAPDAGADTAADRTALSPAGPSGHVADKSGADASADAANAMGPGPA